MKISFPLLNTLFVLSSLAVIISLTIEALSKFLFGTRALFKNPDISGDLRIFAWFNSVIFENASIN